MSNLGRTLGFMILAGETMRVTERRRADEWRALHRRPDAEPLADGDPAPPAPRVSRRLSLGRLLAGGAE
jgi:hypothetical protein